MPGDPDWMGLGKTMADAPPRMSPDEVAANPTLAHAAEVFANLYMLDWSWTRCWTVPTTPRTWSGSSSPT